MKPLLLAFLAALAPAGVPGPAPVARPAPRPADPALPWLYNLDSVSATAAGDPVTAFRMSGLGDPDPSCDPQLHAGFSIAGPLAPTSRPVTVMASYAEGVIVFGAEGELLASTPGFPCMGSADQLEVLALGRAFLEPTIVVVATTGGRREQITWLGLYRVGDDRRLAPVFTAAVEHSEDGIVRRGRITLLPDALLYEPPGDEPVELWTFDPRVHAFTPQGGFDANVPPHA